MLDVHAPDHTPHTLRDFFLHIFTITIGLLIALGLEALVEWRHHVHLAHQAEANLRSELLNNQKDLREVLAAVPAEEKSLANLVQFLREKQEGHKTDRKQVSVGFAITTPQDSTWNTATATGALSYMNFAEVQRFAAAYALQKKFEQSQEDAITPGMALEGMIAVDDPNRLTPQEATEAVRQARLVLAHVDGARQLASALDRAYDEALKE